MNAVARRPDLVRVDSVAVAICVSLVGWLKTERYLHLDDLLLPLACSDVTRSSDPDPTPAHVPADGGKRATPLRGMIWIQPVPDEDGLTPDFVSSMVLRQKQRSQERTRL
jgi:hypothetical protein